MKVQGRGKTSIGGRLDTVTAACALIAAGDGRPDSTSCDLISLRRSLSFHSGKLETRNMGVGKSITMVWLARTASAPAPSTIRQPMRRLPPNSPDLPLEITAVPPVLRFISIGIDSGDPTGNTDHNWTANVLTDGLRLGFVPGFISDHVYVQGAGGESDENLLLDTVSDSTSNDDWVKPTTAYQSLLQRTLRRPSRRRTSNGLPSSTP